MAVNVYVSFVLESRPNEILTGLHFLVSVNEDSTVEQMVIEAMKQSEQEYTPLRVGVYDDILKDYRREDPTLLVHQNQKYKIVVSRLPKLGPIDLDAYVSSSSLFHPATIRSFICYTTLTSFDDKGRASYGNVKSCITPITAKQAVTAAHCVPVNEKIGFLFETMDLDGVVRTVRLMHICRKNDFAFLENLGPDFNYGRPLAELSVGTEYFCAGFPGTGVPPTQLDDFSVVNGYISCTSLEKVGNAAILGATGTKRGFSGSGVYEAKTGYLIGICLAGKEMPEYWKHASFLTDFALHVSEVSYSYILPINMIYALINKEEMNAVLEVISDQRGSSMQRSSEYLETMADAKKGDPSELENALQLYEASLQLKMRTSVMMKKGALLFEMGKLNQAIETYEEAHKLAETEKEKEEITFKLAQAYKERHKLRKSS